MSYILPFASPIVVHKAPCFCVYKVGGFGKFTVVHTTHFEHRNYVFPEF